jgi:hypothetical protein
MARTIPEAFQWLAVVDVAGYIEIVGILWLVAASLRLRAAFVVLRSTAERARQWAARGIAVFATRSRSPVGGRPPRRRPRSKPRNEDGDRPVFGFGLAAA